MMIIGKSFPVLDKGSINPLALLWRDAAGDRGD